MTEAKSTSDAIPTNGNFIYIVGEEQTAVIPENPAVFEFAKANMEKIETGELEAVIGSIFGKGEFFPGPPEAITSIIHEYVRRSEEYASSIGIIGRHCMFLTAGRLINQEIAVRTSAIAELKPEAKLTEGDTEIFYTLLLETIPRFENNFSKEPYAQDSKLVSIIKEAVLYHQQKAGKN